MISKGDVSWSNQTKDINVERAVSEIAQLLQLLVVFMLTNNLVVDVGKNNDDMRAMPRDAWFNIVVHGFTANQHRLWPQVCQQAAHHGEHDSIMVDR